MTSTFQKQRIIIILFKILSKNANLMYCKNYDFVPLPLPSRYRPVTVPLPFLASVTHSPSPFHHRDTPVPHRPSPSLPSLTVLHRPSPSFTVPHRPSPSLTVPHRPSPSLTVPHRPSPFQTVPDRSSTSNTV
jgi:hypothetical protein